MREADREIFHCDTHHIASCPSASVFRHWPSAVFQIRLKKRLISG